MLGTQKLAALSSPRLVSSRSLPLVLRASPAKSNKRTLEKKQSRCFHATPSRPVFRAAWLPMRNMRVKTPWVDALAQSREKEAKNTATNEAPPKPDMTPKRMCDSYFSGVSFRSIYIYICTVDLHSLYGC